MFTASELLDKINSHIADLQLNVLRKGCTTRLPMLLSIGWKKNPPRADADGL